MSLENEPGPIPRALPRAAVAAAIVAATVVGVIDAKAPLLAQGQRVGSEAIPTLNVTVARLDRIEANNADLHRQLVALQEQVNNEAQQVTSLSRSVAGLHSEYARHTHSLGFSFGNPPTVNNPNSTILIPFVTQANLRSLVETGGPVQK